MLHKSVDWYNFDILDLFGENNYHRWSSTRWCPIPYQWIPGQSRNNMSGWLSSGAHSGDGIALVLFGIVWYCLVFCGIIWYYMVLLGIVLYYLVLYGIVWYRMVLCIGCCQGGYRGHILGMGRVSELSPEVLIPISPDTWYLLGLNMW